MGQRWIDRFETRALRGSTDSEMIAMIELIGVR
jgi:hypothetical protein